jgi:hypothetical protein
VSLATAACGIGIVLFGWFHLNELSSIYRTEDFAYTESEQTFELWLTDTIRRGGYTSVSKSNLIAKRLLMMSIPNRRNAVSSMMIQLFWDELAPPGTDRRLIFNLMAEATSKALKLSPLSGDLWLFQAWLRTQTNSFDIVAEKYFLTSHRFTPREGQLALRRLDFIMSLDQHLSAEASAAAKEDLSLLPQLEPSLTRDYEIRLQAITSNEVK